MKQTVDDQAQFDNESGTPPKRGPAIQPKYIAVLLLLVVGVAAFAMSGPACNTKEFGRDFRDLAGQEIQEQAINRLKDLSMTLAFTNTTHVLSRPVPVNPSARTVVVNTVLAVKKTGDTSGVVTHHMVDGVTAYKLRLPDGACGYVFSSDPVQVISQ
jgi:hypothetical protein